MKTFLVGYTGFVGSNLYNQYQFDEVFNSKNIENAFGKNPDLLVYSGIPAQKFIANKDPEADFKTILNAIDNIKKINPKRLVLISTIDVYPKPILVDEDSLIDENSKEAYGRNRCYLENWVKKNFDDYLIVRLPGLYGQNIKKNFIYDVIKFIPSMLTEEKYEELVSIDDTIKDYYKNQGNGFYKLVGISIEEEKILKAYFKKMNFSSLNFTDSRGLFQFYNLSYLWKHICTALDNNIKVLNLATEPVQIREIYRYLFDEEFINELNKPVPYYDFKTKFASIFAGDEGYIFDKNFVLKDIKDFVNTQKSKIKLSISNIAWDAKQNDDIYKLLAASKFDGLEIAPTKIIAKEPYNHIEEAKEYTDMLLDKYNLKISSMQSIWFGRTENMFESEESYDALLEYTKKAIDYASSIHCSNLVFGCPKNRTISDYEQDYNKALNFFRIIGNYAKTKNVVVSIEPNPTIYNTNFLNQSIDAIKFVKDVDNANIRVNYDLGTVIYNKETLDILKEYIEYINHIHISEPNLSLIEERELHRELISILREVNYDKYLSIEMKQTDDIGDVKKVLDYVKGLMGE